MSAPDDNRPPRDNRPDGARPLNDAQPPFEGQPASDERLPTMGLAGLCRHLRTKKYYYGSPDETLESADLSTTAQFWCLRTMRVVGPDEGPVAVRACRPGRSCFDA